MITDETFTQMFVDLFPEYQASYVDHIEFNEELLPHVFFGDVLTVDLIRFISCKSEQEKLQSILDFFERMMVEGDSDVRNIITVTILERLGDDSAILKEAYKYMGTETRKASRDIERYWGRDYPC